jgi:hypothetical protein
MKVRSLALVLMISAALIGCKKEKAGSDYESGGGAAPFSFTIYPGSKRLPEVTDAIRKAQRIVLKGTEPPPTEVYDTDATVEDVANFYAKTYGYKTVAANGDVPAGTPKPPAYYRTGDLHAEAAALPQSIIDQIGLKVDASKAVGTYKGANIDPQPSHPRVTLSRPYFDVTKSQVVDRTMIEMVRE